MYGLPPDLDLNFLSGKSLLQICVGVHDLILNFDRSVSITVTSSIGCAIAGGPHRKFEDFRQAAAVAVVLLYQTVTSAKGDADGTLSMEFHDGGHLDIYDDSKEYESYTIRHGEKLFVV
jgi:hypothetical protein